MGAKVSQITSLTIVYSTVYSDATERKHQSSASLAFVWGIRRWPVNSPHKWPVTRKMFLFDDVNMYRRAPVMMVAGHGRTRRIKDVRGIQRSMIDSPHKGPVMCYGLFVGSPVSFQVEWRVKWVAWNLMYRHQHDNFPPWKNYGVYWTYFGILTRKALSIHMKAVMDVDVISNQNECFRAAERMAKDDGVIKWRHFPRYWPFVRGIHRSPMNSPHKGQWRGALMFSLICAWINRCVNNREAGYLTHYRAHYGVPVMKHRELVTP